MDVAGYLRHTTDADQRKSDYRKLVKQYYDAVTPFYQYGWGEYFHFAPMYEKQPVKKALEAQQDLLARETGMSAKTRALDVGCGIGGPARYLSRTTGAKITGITISPSQVRTAQNLTYKRSLQDRCQVVLGDAMDMDFKDETFDVVYMIESACHMPDKQRFFAECSRVLKPGGVLAGWDWIQAEDLSPRVRQEAIEPICTYFALPSLSTLGGIRSCIEDAGLQVRRIEDLCQQGDPTRRWWDPLQSQLDNVLSRIVCRFSSTLNMMRTSADLLVAAGKQGAFSPLGFFVADKQVGNS